MHDQVANASADLIESIDAKLSQSETIMSKDF